VTEAEAQAAIDRRAALAAMAGASLGELPLLWLIREALEEYEEMLSELPSSIRAALSSVELLTAGEVLPSLALVLTPHHGARILVERNAVNDTVREHEVPNAALVLHDAVKGDPVHAEGLLVTIETATGKGVR